MIEGILLTIIAVLAIIVAVKLAYALLVLAVVVISGVIRGIVVPVVSGVFWLLGQIIALPFRLAGLVLRPVCAAPVSGLMLGTLCRNGACRCPNPASARFCRQCGASIAIG